MYFLRLTKTDKKDVNGLQILVLQMCQSVGATDYIVLHKMGARSGLAGVQNFRLCSVSESGSGEPTPEGYYGLGPIEWAGKVGNYDSAWKTGIGATWSALTPLQHTERSAMGIHLDANVPGTIGCIGLPTKSDEQEYVRWRTVYNIEQVHVNWGLGSVETLLKDITGQVSNVAPNMTGLKVAIDVGHGQDDIGFETGASGYGKREWDLNKVTGLEIKRLVEEAGGKCDVFIYNEGGAAPTLRQKGEKGVDHHLFISVHHNALDGEGPQDADYTLSMVDDSRHTAEDAFFAKVLSKNIARVLGKKDNGCWGDDPEEKKSLGIFGTRLVSWKATRAACLTEGFFMDANAQRNKDMLALAKLEAQGHFEGIYEYALGVGLIKTPVLTTPQSTPVKEVPKTTPTPTPQTPTQPTETPSWWVKVMEFLKNIIDILTANKPKA